MLEKKSVSNILKSIIKYLFILVISIFTGFALLLVAFTLPTKSMELHIAQSVELIDQEGTYPTIFPWQTSQLDNFTDSIMLEEAAYDGDESLVDRALSVYRVSYPDLNPQQSLVAHYNSNLDASVSSYPRYWHGFLIILKPLLTIFNYSQIRVLNIFIQVALMVVLAIQMFKRRYKDYLILMLLSICTIMPLANAVSLQFATMTYIMLIATNIIVYFAPQWEKHRSRLFLFFFITGIVTSYFDFLTYPLVSFGFPFIIYLCVTSLNNDSIIAKLYVFLKALVTWGIGYVGMWSGKWILTALFMDTSIFSDVGSKLIERSSVTTSNGSFSILAVFIENLCAWWKSPFSIIAVVVFLILVIIYFIKVRKIKPFLYSTLLFIPLIILPFIWYVGTSNHSYIHYWFTYKILVICTFSGLCIPCYAFRIAKYSNIKLFHKDEEENL